MARTVAMWGLAALFGLFAITIVFVHEAQIGGWFSTGSWALAGAIVSLMACATFIVIGLGDTRRMRDVRKVFDVDDHLLVQGEYPFVPKLPPDFVRIPPSDERASLLK